MGNFDFHYQNEGPVTSTGKFDVDGKMKIVVELIDDGQMPYLLLVVHLLHSEY